MVFVTDIDLEVAGVEEFAGGVVGFLDGGGERSTVDVDIENGEEDADAAKLAEAEARILSFVDADDFAIGRADEGERIRWGVRWGSRKKRRRPMMRRTAKVAGIHQASQRVAPRSAAAAMRKGLASRRAIVEI